MKPLGPIATVAVAYREGNAPNPSENFDFETERRNRSPRFLEIVTDYANGVPTKDIREKHKCSQNTVLRYARLAGLAKRVKGYGDETRMQAVEMTKAGIPQQQIAKLLGVSVPYVSMVCIKEGERRYMRRDNGYSRARTIAKGR